MKERVPVTAVVAVVMAVAGAARLGTPVVEAPTAAAWPVNPRWRPEAGGAPRRAVKVPAARRVRREVITRRARGETKKKTRRT